MAFDAREFINDYEEGLIDEDGDSVSANAGRLQLNETERFNPVGSMSDQEKRLRVNKYYQGTKKIQRRS